MTPSRKRGPLLRLALGILGALILGVGAFAALAPGRGNDSGTVVSGDKATGAVAVMQQYLAARKAGDADKAYSLLSPAARAAFSVDEFRSYVKDTRMLAFGAMSGATADQKWYRVTVRSVQTNGLTYPAATYTVLKDSGKFYVAMELPLVVDFEQAYGAERYDEALKVANEMIQLNPFSYEGFYDRGWVYNETDRSQDAAADFRQAIALALPTDLPEATRSLGVAQARLRNWAEAVARLEDAARLGRQQADAYDAQWLLQVGRDLVTAYQNKGDTAKAHDLLETLYKQYPSDAAVGSMTVKYERTPYKLEKGMAAYRIFRQGVSFALPQDWVVSAETTGGDWWFARQPKSAPGKVDFEVRFEGDSLGTTLDEAAEGALKRRREPIGAPPRDVSITAKQSLTVGGQPALRVDFSDGATYVLVRSGQQWVEFVWLNSPEAKAAYAGWLPTVKIGQ